MTAGDKRKTAPDQPPDFRDSIRCGSPRIGLGSGVGLSDRH